MTGRGAGAVTSVRRCFMAERPTSLWLADITYLPTHEGWLFLAVVMDAFSRRIVGWSMRDDLKADLVVDALGMAMTRRRPQPASIHHSDRGSQYTSLAFGRTLRELAWSPAWAAAATPTTTPPPRAASPPSRTSSCAAARFTTRDQARLAVFDYIETFYNPRRRHSSLGNSSPDEYEESTTSGRRCLEPRVNRPGQLQFPRPEEGSLLSERSERVGRRSRAPRSRRRRCASRSISRAIHWHPPVRTRRLRRTSSGAPTDPPSTDPPSTDPPPSDPPASDPPATDPPASNSAIKVLRRPTNSASSPRPRRRPPAAPP